MATQGTVVYSSDVVVGNQSIVTNGAYTNFDMHIIYGSWPSQKYKIVSAVIGCTLRNARWDTITVNTGDTTLGAFSAAGTDGAQTQPLVTSYAYSNLSNITLYGGGVGTQISSGSYVTVTIVWELSEVVSTVSLSSSSVDAESSVTATINAASALYTHEILIEFGVLSERLNIGAGVSSQIITIPLSWLSQIPNVQSSPARVTLITYSNEVYIGAMAVTLTILAPQNAAPTFSASCVPLLTVGGTTYPSMGTSVYVQGKSGCTAKITGATAQYGATISGYNIRGGGYSGANATLATGLLNSSGTIPFVFRVTDSRGLYTEKTVNISVLAYASPKVTSLIGWRVDAAGTSSLAGTLGKCKAVWSYSQLNSANTCAAKIYIKPTGGSETLLNAAMASNSTYWIATSAGNMTLTATTRYVLRLALTDKYGTVSVTADLPSAAFAMHLNAAGNSIAFGKACERSNAVEIAARRTLYLGDSTLRDWIRNTFFPVGAIYQSHAATSPASLFGGTWTQIQNRFLVGVGSSYAAGATGGEATHKLTVNELPSHSHNYSYPGYEAGGKWYGASGTAKGNTVATTAVGGGAAHENRPPYFAVYIWRRTA